MENMCEHLISMWLTVEPNFSKMFVSMLPDTLKNQTCKRDFSRPRIFKSDVHIKGMTLNWGKLI